MKPFFILIISLLFLPCFASTDGEGRTVQSREGQPRKAQQRQATTGEHQIRTDGERKAEPRKVNTERTPMRVYRERKTNSRAHSRYVQPRRYRRRPTHTRYKVRTYFEKRFDTNHDGYLSLDERQRMVDYVQRNSKYGT